MEDYVGQRNLLITTFGLEAAMHTQLVSFNATFVVSIFFCVTGVGLWVEGIADEGGRIMRISSTASSATRRIKLPSR